MQNRLQSSATHILESWQRCSDLELEKNRIRPKQFIDGAPLQELLAEYASFMQVASPILENMSALLTQEELALILCDEKACVLDIFASSKVLLNLRERGVFKGVYLTERSAGTNAVSMVLVHDTSIQVRGEEHYFEMFGDLTASAAPIRMDQKTEACVCLLGANDSAHSNGLALVSAIAKSIETAVANTEVQKKLFDSNMYAFAMMNSLSYGVFAIDMNDHIHWVNDTACRKLNIRRLLLLEKQIKDLYPDWPKAKKNIIEQLSFDDVEGQFSLSELKEKFLFNAIPIKTKKNTILGFILMFRELSRMMKALNKYTGMEAQFVFDDIITKDPRMSALITNAKAIAKTPSPVLITGEMGVGKEVLAQSIHNAGERADAPFIALNCGAISPTLIESELFGYEDGSFTGAKRGGKPGKFELANGGTLFLDEIGEMPLDIQVKLLRFLQEGTVLRIGGSKSMKVDVRVIAATHKNLHKEVHAERFRLDLFYRLDVVPLRIPPLRERKQDIELLLQYFLQQKAEKLKMNLPDLRPELIKRIMEYPFPGNARELESFAEKAVLFGGKLSLDMLDGPLLQESPLAKKGRIPKSIEDAEKEVIQESLNYYRGNISKASLNLGISRNALYMKIKKYQLNPNKI